MNAGIAEAKMKVNAFRSAIAIFCVLVLAAGCSAPQAKASVRSPGEQALLQQMRTDAVSALRAVNERANAGEPLTPTFVALQCAWSRRVCLSTVRVADDQAARVAAVDAYVQRLEDLLGMLTHGVDVSDRSPLPALEAKYWSDEAKLWAARVRRGETLGEADMASAGPEDATLLEHVAVVSREKLALLDERRNAGEPLTPTFVEECSTTQRRLALTEIQRAPDRASRITAAERNAQRATDNYSVLAEACVFNAAAAERQRLQIFQLRYFLSEAQWWHLRVQTEAGQ
jgi:hypothetical protein